MLPALQCAVLLFSLPFKQKPTAQCTSGMNSDMPVFFENVPFMPCLCGGRKSRFVQTDFFCRKGLNLYRGRKNLYQPAPAESETRSFVSDRHGGHNNDYQSQHEFFVCGSDAEHLK